MKKFLKTVFFEFFLCFLKILNPYLIVLGKYLIGCTCQKSEKKCKYFKINLNGAIIKKILCQRFFVLKSKKVAGEFSSIFRCVPGIIMWNQKHIFYT